MDDYLKQFREMISLRGLTDHTIVSYSTYIRAYLDYLSNILHKMPEDVSWAELRDFIPVFRRSTRKFPAFLFFSFFVSSSVPRFFLYLQQIFNALSGLFLLEKFF